MPASDLRRVHLWWQEVLPGARQDTSVAANDLMVCLSSKDRLGRLIQLLVTVEAKARLVASCADMSCCVAVRRGSGVVTVVDLKCLICIREAGARRALFFGGTHM